MSGGSNVAAAERRDEVVGLMQSLPLTVDDVAFDEPWQLRAFALAVAAHKSGRYEWSAFRSALVSSIGEWESSGDGSANSWSYYEHWVNAVESVLSDGAGVDGDELDSRVRDVLSTPANRNHHEPNYEPVAVHPGIQR